MEMTIEMLAAGYGDCLILQYGAKGRRPRRVLIDGGTPESYGSLKARIGKEGKAHFDLVVVTHVDSDHIGGVLKLLADGKLEISFDDIWFNGFKHMEPYLERAGGNKRRAKAARNIVEVPDILGPGQGEDLVKLIQKGPWNKAFSGGPIVIEDGKPLPSLTLSGGLKLTVLSPTEATLQNMAKVWRAELKKLGDSLGKAGRARPTLPDLPDLLGGAPNVMRLATEETSPDDAAANGSSIALLAELGNSSCLLGADAWPGVLVESIQRLLVERKAAKLSLGGFKLPHHGSRRNVTKQLLQLIDTRNYLVSTNGARFSHPNAEAIARIVAPRKGAQLHFNYASPFTEPWSSPTLQARYGFTATYPQRDGTPVVVSV